MGKYVTFGHIWGPQWRTTDPRSIKIGRDHQSGVFDPPPSTGFVVEVPGGSTRTNGRSCSYSDVIRKGKLDSRSTLVKNFGTLMDLLFRNFFLKVPPVGRFEVVEPLVPPHNLTPSLRGQKPRNLGIFVLLRTIFRCRSS